jgi:adenosylcobinamide-phosphate synthase
MHLALSFAVAVAADLVLGDPEGWPHPVRWIGRLSQAVERRLYADSIPAGMLHWLVVAGGTLLALQALHALGDLHPFAEHLLAIYVIYACLAVRSLHVACRAVESQLGSGGLEPGRRALSCIVGRETDRLDEPGVRRAVLETLAENLSDGVIAPLVFLLIGGPPLMLVYKAINTLDSMIGYRNERYRRYGRAAARIDDAANLVPARMSGALLVVAAGVLGMDCRRALVIMRRDHAAASSPNAGWPEAALAGALGVRLGGPGRYFGKVVDKPWIGEDLRDPGPRDYVRAVRLLYVASLLAAGLVFAALALTGAGWWGLLGVLA